MPYLGNEPGAITDAFTDTFTGDASAVAFTLTQASTTNSVFVRIHGVMQRNGTDFNVDGTTITFTTAPPAASNNVVVQFFTIGSVQAVADNAITLAKLAGGTDGNIISFDASGDPVAVATGNDGQVLTSAGAGAPPAFEALPATTAAGYEFVSVVTADDSADNVSFTNHVSGYDYQYRWSNLTPGNNDTQFRAELGTSGPSYLTSGYLGTSMETNSAASTVSNESTDYMMIGYNNYDGTEPDSAAGLWNVFDPAGSGVTKVMGQEVHRNSGNTFYNGMDFFYHSSAASHTAIKFYFSAGNVEAGVFVQYRRKLSA